MPSRPVARGGLRGLNRDAGSKRRERPGTGPQQGGQPAGALDDDGVGLEVAAFPAGEGVAWRVARALWWGGKRLRRIGMVAGARKWLLARGRVLKSGVFPEGAVLKEA